MRKIFHDIHLWLSIPFGVLITLICFSGAALVFEKEVMELSRPHLYFVEKTEAAPLPMEELMARVAATLPAGVSATGVNVSSDPERAYQVTLSKPRRASVYVNQYTGRVTGSHERAPFFNTMFRMHRWLLHSMKPDGGIYWGKVVVGVSTLMFVFVLISGVVIWWPRTKKALKNSLKIAAGKGWRRFCYDLHVAGGMYALLLLLVMALTGLTWSFEWYKAGFYKVFGVEVQPAGMGHGKAAAGAAPYTHWQEVYNRLAQANPDYRQISVGNGSASVAFGRYGNQRATDRYEFNPHTGEITAATLYKDLENAGKIRGWIYSVHVGSWGGMLTRILSFIAALIGASLPLTGYYLWIRKRMRRTASGGAAKPSM